MKRLITRLSVILVLMIASIGYVVHSPIALAQVSPPTLHRPSKGPFTATTTTGYNVLWMDNASITGVRLDMSAGINANLTSSSSPYDTALYHTMRPPNTACIEIVIYHWRDTANIMRNYFGAAPWCGGLSTLTYFQNMDATWAGKYVRSLSTPNWDNSNPIWYNDETIHVTVEKVVAATNCWSFKLYNYNTGVWDTLGSPSQVCGSANDPVPGDGWTSMEQYFRVSTGCVSLGNSKVMESRKIQIQTVIGGAYNNIPTANVTYTDKGATLCEPNPWNTHHVLPYYGESGYVLCDPFLNSNCD